MGVKQDIVQEIFKPRRKKFARRRVEIRGLNDLMEIDLMDVQRNKKDNNGKGNLDKIDLMSLVF